MMRTLMLTAATMAVASPCLDAQQWSEDQREVLEAVTACWDIWVDAVESGSPDAWLDDCQTDDSTFWVGAEGSPTTSDSGFLRRNWGRSIGIDEGWIDLRPIVIRVRDDVAVLHFYGYWQLPDEVEEWRRTEVWRRDGGRWKQWAGHATPVG